MANRTLQTDWKRIGRSGLTTDGREVKPEWLTEMADSYDKDYFTALIWPEHQRYANYGTIEALRSTSNSEGGVDLWAIIAPNPLYQGSNNYGQKLFTSMEITFDFRKSGKAYLTGLGATDNPASIATSEIRFSRYAQEVGKQLSGYIESETQTFTDQQPASLLDQVKALFKNQNPEDTDMADTKALQQVQTELAEVKLLLTKLAPAAEPPKTTAQDDVAEAVVQLTKRLEELEAQFSASREPPEKKAAGHDELSALIEKFSALEAVVTEALKEQPGTPAGQHFGHQGDSSHLE